MTRAYRNGDVLENTTREHHNHDHQGYCCPYCSTDSDAPFTAGERDRKALQCENCEEFFAVWDERIVQHVSGFIIDENQK